MLLFCKNNKTVLHFGVGRFFLVFKSFLKALLKFSPRLFQKAGGFQRQSIWSHSAECEMPLRKELRRGESDKTIRWIVFRRGAPCDRGRPWVNCKAIHRLPQPLKLLALFREQILQTSGKPWHSIRRLRIDRYWLLLFFSYHRLQV